MLGKNSFRSEGTITLLSDVYRTINTNSHGVVDVAHGTTLWWRSAFHSLMRVVGDMPVEELTPAMVSQWYARLMETHQVNSANNYVHSVKCAYYRLMRRGLAEYNPACYIQLAPPDPHLPAAATLETYLAMRDQADLRQRAILSFVWGTGCRISEVSAVKLAKLEFWYQDDTLCMASEIFGKHKRRRPDRAKRVVYADDIQAHDVHTYYESVISLGRPYLFTSEDGRNPMPVATIRNNWLAMAKAAGLDSDVVFNPHSFRHAFAYRKRADGYPLEWISQWLGHADPQFTAKFYGDKTEHESRRRFFKPPPAPAVR